LAGPTSPPLWAAIVFATVMGGVFTWVTHRERSWHAYGALTVGLMLIGCMFPFLWWLFPFFSCLLLAFIGVPLAVIEPSWRKSVLVATIVPSIVIGGVLWQGTARQRRMEAWRGQFPVESLDSRLGYEDVHEKVEPPELSGRVEAELRTSEGRSTPRSNLRSFTLERLHTEASHRFAITQGFGVSRMPSLTERALASHSIYDVTLREPRHEGQYRESEYHDETVWEFDRRGSTGNELADLHWFGADDFLHPAAWGYVDGRRRVSGFLPHAFHQRPPVRRDAYVIGQLNLVSLLRFETPRVYLSGQLPRMDQLSSQETPTRALDAFETEAIGSLHGATDVVIDYQGRQIRMLGALRADSRCLECHQVARGELLGAFTYRITKR
ncbi:MAG: hypothetical protein KDA60_19380, partial [Planctomycetales bacterium]|nr:hypothetical protein [Planctomycetales bacterium]